MRRYLPILAILLAPSAVRADPVEQIRPFKDADVEKAVNEALKVWRVPGAAVAVVHETELESVLVAYYAGEETPQAELTAFLRELLPLYMVPGRITHLPELPLNANGKPDRRRLSQSLWAAHARRIN